MVLADLGICRFSIGSRQKDLSFVFSAEKLFREMLKKSPKSESDYNQAAAQTNLGNALTEIGKRQGNSKILHEALEVVPLIRTGLRLS